MYNEELEMLIDAALADGVLTDEEKQILFRKAQQYGVNLDEFEMVLEGRLAKVRAQRQQQAAPTPNKQRGPKKCPACGALIQSMQVKCPECGYEFHNVEANSTVKQLQQKLDEIEASAKPGDDKLSSVLSSGLIDPIGRRKAAVIKSCPVPNSKDDLIELLTLCSTNYTPSVNDRNNYEASAWKSKYKQVRAKAKLLLKNDPDLEQVLLETDKAVKVNSIKKNLIWIPLLVLALIFVYVIPNFFISRENEKKEEAKTELSVTTDKVEQLISSGDYDQAATVLSLCKADVADSETSALYSSMVMKVAGELLDRGDSTKAENLYNSAVAKLGSYHADALDPLAQKLGIETKSMREAAEQAEKDAAEAQSSSDNSADTVADESVSSSDDGEQSSSSKLKDKARNWLDKQIDKAADKMNKKIDKAADKMNKKIDKEIEKLAQ